MTSAKKRNASDGPGDIRQPYQGGTRNGRASILRGTQTVRDERVLKTWSTACVLAQCSLQNRIERAKKPRPVSLGQRGRSPRSCPKLPQVSGYLTTGERVSDVRLSPPMSCRGD